MEVFTQRLQDEFNMNIIMTSPSVPYLVEYADGTTKHISNIALWPEGGKGMQFVVKEPMVKVILITPKEYYGEMCEIVKERRGTDIETQFLEDGSVVLSTTIPWQEVVGDMNDAVKHSSSGYATFNYEEGGYRASDLIKVEIAVNGEPCDPLSFVTHTDKATTHGRKLIAKLKEVLDRQQFEIVLQARIGSKVSRGSGNILYGYMLHQQGISCSQHTDRQNEPPNPHH
jgi:GTP-binding protein LepA